jgi:signal transduction histidine kinase
MEYITQFLSIGLLVLSGMINFTIGIFIYFFAYKLSHGKYVSSKYFAYSCFGVFTWALWLCLSTLYFYPMGHIWGIYITNIAIYITVISTLQSLVFFGLSFHNTQRTFHQYQFLYYPYILVAIIILIPQFGIFQLDVNNPIAYQSLAYYIFTLYIISYSIIYISLLIYRYTVVESHLAKRHIQMILIGTIFSLLSAFVANIILPILLDNTQFIYYGPISTLVLSVLVLIAIIRYRLFRMQLPIAGLMTTLAITIILLIVRFVIIDNNFSQGLQSTMLVVFMFTCLYTFLTREAYIGAQKQIILDNKKQELEIALNSKNDFLKNASHQLRTPLTVIQGYLAMITGKEDPKYELNQAALDDLQKTYISAKNLNEIINDVLAANDINAGRFGINIKDSIDLKELIETIIEEKCEFFKSKSTKVVLKNKGLIAQAFVDKGKLKEALNNIIDNAVFYGKGKVTITLDAKGKEFFIISVQDNGVGITREDAKKIWQKFERGKKSALINPNGSGLGLYLAKQIMLKHGGDIEAHSDGRDQGSIFIFTLPKDTLTHAPAESFGINIPHTMQG